MNRIQRLREEKGWTQERLGKELHCSDAAVSYYETGKRGLNTETISRLCAIFGCTSDYLLCKSDVPTEATPENYQAVSADEADLLRRYNALNEAGREQLIRYTDYLMSCPEYLPGDNTVQVG